MISISYFFKKKKRYQQMKVIAENINRLQIITPFTIGTKPTIANTIILICHPQSEHDSLHLKPKSV